MTTTREALAALLAAQRRCCEPLPDGSHCERPATHSYDCCPDSCAEHAPPHEARHDGLADAIEQAERALAAAEPVTVTLTERGWADLVITVDGRGPGATMYEASVSLLSPAKDAAAIVAELLGAKVVRR